MDGDAWGSLNWLALTLWKIWKIVEWINDTPVPENLGFLWNTKLINPSLDVEVFNPDIIISLDAWDVERLWETYKKWKHIFDEKPLIMIDHHISNTLFGDVNILDTSAWSTAELLVNILLDLGLESYITPDAATSFYTGIQTDSNMYFNTNTTSRTLRTWAKLIDLWAEFRLPVTECFKKKNFIQMKLWEKALKNMKQDFDGKLSYTYLSTEDLSETWISLQETSEYMKGFINEVLINIDGTKIAFLLYPISDTEQKWSLRSQEWYDVNAVCWKFWWWWHLQASWFQKQTQQDQLIVDLINEIKQVLT